MLYGNVYAHDIFQTLSLGYGYEGRSSITLSCMIKDLDMEDFALKNLINQIGEKAQVPFWMNHRLYQLAP